jgi:hypothetical protein
MYHKDQYKSISEMQKDERLKLGGNLIARKEDLAELRKKLLMRIDERSDKNYYDSYDVQITIVADPGPVGGFYCNLWSNGGSPDAITSEMRVGGMERCKMTGSGQSHSAVMKPDRLMRSW